MGMTPALHFANLGSTPKTYMVDQALLRVIPTRRDQVCPEQHQIWPQNKISKKPQPLKKTKLEVDRN